MNGVGVGTAPGMDARSCAMSPSGIIQMLARRARDAGVPRASNCSATASPSAFLAAGGQEGGLMRLAERRRRTHQRAHKRMKLGDRL